MKLQQLQEARYHNQHPLVTLFVNQDCDKLAELFPFEHKDHIVRKTYIKSEDEQKRFIDHMIQAFGPPDRETEASRTNMRSMIWHDIIDCQDHPNRRYIQALWYPDGRLVIHHH